MEENKFTGHDSLELIAQMIQQSKKNMKVGNGNILLHYGYMALMLSVVVYLFLCWTDNPVWSALWFLMFMPSIWIGLQKKGSKARIITHMDKAIGNTWNILGWLFFLTVIGITVFVYFTGNYYCFALMLPLSLLYAGIGVAIMGVITEFKLMVYTPLVAFAVAIYMLALMVTGTVVVVVDWWNLLFGLSFLIMMIIPGHVLNCKMKELC